MGSDVSLKFYQQRDDAAAQAFLLIKQWEDRLTVNRNGGNSAAQSEIAQINAAAGKSAVRVSPETFILLKRAKQTSLYPAGCFNFAIGPIVKAWNIGFAARRIPSAAELAALLPLTDPRLIPLDSADYSVFLPKRGMKIDLGGIAKGFIADRVKQFLSERGIDSALINLGGNVLASGAPLCRTGLWSIGLRKPFGAGGELLGLIYARDKSVVTSGIYERYFTPGSEAETDEAKRQETLTLALRPQSEQGDNAFCHHIFDPRTGLPLHNDLMSVTIISDISVDGEIWSSLLYGMGAAKGAEFLRNICNRNDSAAFPPPPLGAIFVTKDKRIILAGEHNFQFALLDKTYRLIE